MLMKPGCTPVPAGGPLRDANHGCVQLCLRGMSAYSALSWRRPRRGGASR